MKKIAIILFLLGVVPLSMGQNLKSVSKVGPSIFLEEIQRGDVQLIDVRTPTEFEEGHLDNAVNIDFFSEDFMAKFSELDKEKPILLYCRSGNRSGKAAKQLSEAGFITIIDLENGYPEMEKYIKEKNLEKNSNE